MDMPNPAAAEAVIWVYFTVDTEKHARIIAATLVEEDLAACTNVMQQHISYYKWEGEIRSDYETAVIAKTTRARFEELRARIRSMPGHSVPAIVALPAVDGDAEYLDWVRQAVRQGTADIFQV